MSAGAKQRMQVLVLVAASILLGGCAANGDSAIRLKTVTCIQWSSEPESVASGLTVSAKEYLLQTGETRQLEESFLDRINVIWCSEKAVRRSNTFPPAPRETVGVVSSEQAQDILLGLPRSMPIQQERHSCHPGKGLVAITCTAYRPPLSDPESDRAGARNRDSLQFFCLLEKATGRVTFVDSVSVQQESGFPPFYLGYFDSSGTHFYYRKYEHAFRYSIETGRIDTMPKGEIPLIAWNGAGTIVYSRSESTFYLLDDSLRVKAAVRGQLKKLVYSTLALKEHAFLVGVHNSNMWTMWMDIYLLDFDTATWSKLFSAASPGQILDAEIAP